jgi:hypothetical protein
VIAARPNHSTDTPVPARAGAGTHPGCPAGGRYRLVLIGSSALFTAVMLLASATPHAATVAAPARPQFRYADGAPPGFSGGFKEQACDACHFEAKPNTPPGQVTLTGVPERYVPGQKYPLAVALSRPGLALGGFQLAARFADGTQAGSFERGAGEEKRVAVETQGSVQYVNQKRPGADPTAADTAKWTVIWTAPAGGAVTFHVAANAADKDESARGDYVFTATATSRP